MRQLQVSGVSQRGLDALTGGIDAVAKTLRDAIVLPEARAGNMAFMLMMVIMPIRLSIGLPIGLPIGMLISLLISLPICRRIEARPVQTNESIFLNT